MDAEDFHHQDIIPGVLVVQTISVFRPLCISAIVARIGGPGNRSSTAGMMLGFAACVLLAQRGHRCRGFALPIVLALRMVCWLLRPYGTHRTTTRTRPNDKGRSYSQSWTTVL